MASSYVIGVLGSRVMCCYGAVVASHSCTNETLFNKVKNKKNFCNTSSLPLSNQQNKKL